MNAYLISFMYAPLGFFGHCVVNRAKINVGMIADLNRELSEIVKKKTKNKEVLKQGVVITGIFKLDE